jgi:glycosyltransferase involved in cell wall biosynthesis
VHDYLTQRGGAERVALLLTKAFPGAPLYTSLYEPAATFPEFVDVDVRPMPINRIGILRRNHRLALPVLAPSFSFLRIDADVVICSSSGWAHGVRTTGRKVVYCHAPQRWLYQRDRYLASRVAESGFTGTTSVVDRTRQLAATATITALAAPLRRWDRHAASSADHYIAVSAAVATMVQEHYGIAAQVVHAPPPLDADGITEPVDGIAPGYFLCVSRLLPYKNVGAIVDAVVRNGRHRLVVVGDGPTRGRYASDSRVRFVGTVDDRSLRWLYRNATALVAASYEDYGLTPLEAASFGKPGIALRSGGYLDTVVEGRTGLFFDQPVPEAIAAALQEAEAASWDATAIVAHASTFSQRAFIDALRDLATLPQSPAGTELAR